MSHDHVTRKSAVRCALRSSRNWNILVFKTWSKSDHFANAESDALMSHDHVTRKSAVRCALRSFRNWNILVFKTWSKSDHFAGRTDPRTDPQTYAWRALIQYPTAGSNRGRMITSNVETKSARTSHEPAPGEKNAVRFSWVFYCSDFNFVPVWPKVSRHDDHWAVADVF